MPREMRVGESVEWDEILAEGLMLDEREYHPLGDVPPLVESAAPVVTDGGAAGDRSALFEAVLGDLGRGRSSASEESHWVDLVEGSRRRGEEAGRSVTDPRRVGPLGLLVEERRDPHGAAAADMLAEDARQFANHARTALAEGVADEEFIGELRALLADAEPVVRARRRAQLDRALAGERAPRRRRPYPGLLEELGLATSDRGGR